MFFPPQPEPPADYMRPQTYYPPPQQPMPGYPPQMPYYPPPGYYLPPMSYPPPLSQGQRPVRQNVKITTLAIFGAGIVIALLGGPVATELAGFCGLASFILIFFI